MFEQSHIGPRSTQFFSEKKSEKFYSEIIRKGLKFQKMFHLKSARDFLGIKIPDNV